MPRPIRSLCNATRAAMAVGGAVLLLAGCSHVPRRPLPPAAPAQREVAPVGARVEPPAPAELTLPVKRIRDAEYVSLRDLASALGLEAAGTGPGKVMVLRDSRGRSLSFENGQNEYRFDGLRVFLGERIAGENDTLWIGKLDAVKSVLPLLRSGARPARNRPAGPWTIVLDPGHGGLDPGTENRRLNLQEKAVTLDVALRVKRLLEQGGWAVALTRRDDRELAADKKTDLRMRDDLATLSRADLFLSIHFNHAEARVSGVETYIMAPQSMLSTGDSQADELTGVAFPGNRCDAANLLLGERLHRGLVQTLQAPDRGLKRGRRAVLRMLDCPGALLECGYLSNDDEARRLGCSEYRERIARAIVAGVDRYAASE